MNRKHDNLNHLIYIVVGIALAAVFQWASASPYNETGQIRGFNFNLFVYVAALAGAFVLFLVLSVFGDFFTRGRDSDVSATEMGTARRIADALLYVVYGAAAAAILLLIYEIYINENNLWPGTASPSYLRQELNHRYYFAVIFLIAAVLFFTLSRDAETRKNRPFRIGLAGIFSLLNAIATWCPNIFQDNGGGVPHVHAVLNSIVNVAHFVPYSELNCSIYGHFGLVFLPFVKLLGNNLTAILLAISVFTFITFFCAFYVASRLIQRSDLYAFACMAITGTTTILTRRGQYFQINPLRLLFPMLTLAVITFGAFHMTTRDVRRTRILEYVVGILAVVWNFETGLFCVAVFAAVRVFRTLFHARIFSKETLLSLLRAALYGVLSLVGAYALVNVYNLLTGGEVNSVRLFIYPLLSGTYNVNNLRVPLPSVKFLYFFQILLFFLTAAAMLRRQQLGESEDMATDIVRFGVALSGLSSLIYFINRAAYSNMSIAHIQMILLLGSYGQYALHLTKYNWRTELAKPAEFLRSSVAILLFGGFVWMAIEGALYVEVCYDNRFHSSWQTEDYERGLEELRQKIPENTFAFGYCVPEVWYQLGWDNICFMTDWSDINDYNQEYAVAEAKKRDAFVTTTKNIKFKGYKVAETVTIGPYDFKLYVKKEAGA